MIPITKTDDEKLIILDTDQEVKGKPIGTEVRLEITLLTHEFNNKEKNLRKKIQELTPPSEDINGFHMISYKTNRTASPGSIFDVNVQYYQLE